MSSNSNPTTPPLSSLHRKVAEVVAQVGTVHKGKVNPAFKSRYTELPQIYRQYREPLLQVGVAISNHLDQTQVTTRLTCLETGAVMSSSFPLPQAMQVGGLTVANKKTGETVMLPWATRPLTAQELKAASTYGIRTNLLALLALEESDDDGNEASGIQTGGDTGGVWY